jgi:hypothetical protein
MSPTPPKKSIAKKLRQFFAWSFSRFCDYRECPAKAAYKHIDRLEAYTDNDAEVQRLVELRAKGKVLPADTEPFVRGSVVHKLAENYSKSRVSKLPSELATFKKEFQDLRKYKMIEEQQWAFNSSWEPTSWFDRTTWVRVIVDAHYERSRSVFHVIDYKTGKAPSKPDAKTPSWNNEKFFQHQEQREIYAIAVFIMYPDCERVNAAHWYLDSGVEFNESFERGKDFERLKKKWEKTVKPMMNDRSFVARPSIQACKFCNFKKSNGGPCKY